MEVTLPATERPLLGTRLWMTNVRYHSKSANPLLTLYKL